MHLGLHFVGDDMGKRCFAQPRRAVQKHMLDRFAATVGCLYGDLQFANQLFLADVLIKCLGVQRVIKAVFLLTTGLSANDTFSSHRPLV